MKAAALLTAAQRTKNGTGSTAASAAKHHRKTGKAEKTGKTENALTFRCNAIIHKIIIPHFSRKVKAFYQNKALSQF